MSAIKVLRTLKSRREAKRSKKRLAVEWGAVEYLTKVGVDSLTRKELRGHLEARELELSGTRKQLIERLQRSLKDEQLHSLAYTDAVDAEFMLYADLEERGSVYTVGCNESGQLGLGDLEPRHAFSVIPETRGHNFAYLAASADMVIARTDDDEVYVWGGGSAALSGVRENRTRDVRGQRERYLTPRLVEKLLGEEIERVALSGSHVVAVSKGGDCFVWGAGDAGQLGLGDLKMRAEPAVNMCLPAVREVATGANHTVVITEAQEVYVWGHSADGRLGLGARERKGVPDDAKSFYPSPCLLPIGEPIRAVACGREHTLAVGASGVWAWGLGSGGKLGVGDTRDRHTPCLIEKLKGRCVLKIGCGTWHSAAIVQYPPMLNGGKVYSWGSGFHGQLGQGRTQIVLEPGIVPYFVEHHHLLDFLACGSHHSAVLTTTRELYTWGSNKHFCLGHNIDEVDVEYTPEPGHCGGFGALVNKVGRGLPRFVVCGHEFTVVATMPYEGPELQVAMKLAHEQYIREQELTQRMQQEDYIREMEDHETY